MQITLSRRGTPLASAAVCQYDGCDLPRVTMDLNQEGVSHLSSSPATQLSSSPAPAAGGAFDPRLWRSVAWSQVAAAPRGPVPTGQG